MGRRRGGTKRGKYVWEKGVITLNEAKSDPLARKELKGRSSKQRKGIGGGAAGTASRRKHSVPIPKGLEGVGR